MRNAIGSGRILLVDVRDNSRKIGRSLRRPFDLHREPNQEPRIRSIWRRTSSWETVFALIERGEALANLLPEPFVMIKATRNQLAHDLVRRFTRLRGDPV